MAVAPEPIKLSLQLTAVDGHLLVQADSSLGEASAVADAPEQGLLAPLVGSGSGVISPQTLKSIGESLSAVLFKGDVGQLVEGLAEASAQTRQPTRCELRFNANQLPLARFPWELITDSAGRFLVRDGIFDLTRYINYPQPPPPFDLTGDNKTLFQIISQPAHLPVIAGASPGVEPLEILQPALYEQLMVRLLIDRLAAWGLQFNGHGALVVQCGRCETVNSLGTTSCRQCGASLAGGLPQGALAFERNGEVDWIPVKNFGEILFNAHIQLAVLLASDSARVNGSVVFNGLTPGLILAGVPAAIGMQTPVSDHFAGLFLRSFYVSLFWGQDVLAALRTARHIVGRDAWYSPALYLRHQKTPPAEPVSAAYLSRNIDTAVPAQARAGDKFLVRLWIRRPETRPLSETDLRAELDIPASVPVSTRETETDLKFEPVEGRKLRRGTVEVKLTSHECDIVPAGIKLFVDEDMDAPPAIFTVQARESGSTSLIFSLWQDGGQIASITHGVEIVAGQPAALDQLQHGSTVLPLVDIAALPVPDDETELKQLIVACQRYLTKLKDQASLMGAFTPPFVLIQIEDAEAKLQELQVKLASLSATLPQGGERVPPTPPGEPEKSILNAEPIFVPPDILEEVDLDDTTVVLEDVDILESPDLDDATLVLEEAADDSETTMVGLPPAPAPSRPSPPLAPAPHPVRSGGSEPAKGCLPTGNLSGWAVIVGLVVGLGLVLCLAVVIAGYVFR